MFNEFLLKLERLNPDQPALWGKMTPQHMVEHLIFSMQICNGKLEVPCLNTPEKLLQLKNFLFSEKPFPRLFINPVIGPDLFELKCRNLNEALNNLREEISAYKDYFIRDPGRKPVHMIFGDLGREGWDMVHKKHFTHHLSQFGFI